MPTQELHSLVNLLDDPDSIVYRAVASRLLEQGNHSIPYLEHEWTLTENNKKRERIENLIQQIQTADVEQGLQEWLDGPDHNLLEGAYWVAKERYPALRFDELEQTVDDITKDIWVALADENLPPLNRINIFNKFFYRIHKFGISNDDTLNPTYCFINRVLETKNGNDASLGLLYLHIAQQIGLPIYGVCVPGLFLLAYINSFGDILCYINPSNQGLWSSKQAVTNYFVQRGIEPRKHYYLPCSNTAVLLRLIEFIVFTCEQESSESQARIYRSFIPLFKEKTTNLLGEEPL